MVYLILTIVSAVLFATSYKIASKRGCNLFGVNLVFYIIATGLCLLLIIFFRSWQLPWQTVILAIVGGFSAFASTLTFFYVMRAENLSTMWTVISLAVVIPTFASIILWKEYPNIYQWLGIGLMLIALPLLSQKE
jgi:drug/metabolite transporter (DMT)-like permease